MDASSEGSIEAARRGLDEEAQGEFVRVPLHVLRQPKVIPLSVNMEKVNDHFWYTEYRTKKSQKLRS